MSDDWTDATWPITVGCTTGHAYWRNGDHGLGGGPRLDWIVAGCESGHGARPTEVDWFRALRDQCAAAGRPRLAPQGRRADRPALPRRRAARRDGPPSTGRPLTRRAATNFQTTTGV